MSEELSIKEIREAVKLKFGKIVSPHDGYNLKLPSISALKSHVNNEYTFWNKLLDQNRSQFYDLVHTYTDLKNNINKLSTVKTKQELDELIRLIYSDLVGRNTISSKSILGQFIYNEYKLNPQVAAEIYNYFRRNPKLEIDSKMHVAIKVTLINLKISHSKIIAAKTEKIEHEINQFQTDLSQIQSDYDSIKNQSSSLTTEYEETLRLLKESNINESKSFEEKVTSLINEWQKKITDLENLYNDKLSLEAPVDHWENLEKEYKKNGLWWTIGAVVIACCIAGIAIYLIMNLQPNPRKDFSAFDIKQFIIITLSFTGLSYLLSLFIKQALSSFHLAKDAKERLQLTKVYLAMLGNKSIQNEERLIVLQSLFSRADTGLIKGDGAPTMPSFGSNILDILNKTKTGSS
ncbi:MAG: hypothetical protein EDM75_00745 [Chlorobiota bacterium]|nr:MAG: hypothetical protein EDM75_00745 [Chlorobiota bacterium]